jgi:mannitol/fructose-specific phosphotransferase system IIA component (Ntr-type)
MGTQKHYWIAPKKAESNNANTKILKQLYPNLKADELELLAQLNDAKSIKQLAKAHGWEDQDIKTK